MAVVKRCLHFCSFETVIHSSSSANMRTQESRLGTYIPGTYNGKDAETPSADVGLLSIFKADAFT